MSGSIYIEELGPTIGARLGGVDSERLLTDPDLPEFVLAALETHGVLVFPQIGVADSDQVAFGRRLGTLVTHPGHPIPEVTVITQDPDNPLADYLRGNTFWHIDGAMDEVPCMAGILSARVISPGDGATEFASTYAAYDDLTVEEKERFARLRVIHSLSATLRPIFPDPTPEQLATWSRRPSREHPLVWTHRSGRRSLVYGSTADHIVGVDEDAGHALLADLLARGTRPGFLFRHEWSVGDMVIWDNRGVLHRSTRYESTSRRELHRVTICGDEAIA
ncbi:MAG TPA: TauD/TfdA family dioxygenase [Acidimicrobiales bacterium]|nr:TauD/TfdA family dioxygenase [Acidimicrobiales bacterium]